MDRVYRQDIPAAREALEQLRKQFAELDTATDWTALRVRLLLDHVKALQQVLESPRFANEVSRLRRGVSMFRSDLVYLRENIKALRAILEHEQGRRAKSSERVRAGTAGRSSKKTRATN